MIHGLPEKLKKSRQQFGYSQQEVATRLGISPSIISSYETGERTPSTENLLALSYLYRCSTDYLLGKSNQEPIIQIDANGLSPEHIKAINILIDGIKNNHK